MLVRTALSGCGLVLLTAFAWPSRVPVEGREGLAPKDAAGPKADLWVDGERGRPGAPGTRDQPCQSLSQAIGLLPDPLTRSVTIRVVAGTYTATGGQDMPAERLELMRRMRPGVSVRIVG